MGLGISVLMGLKAAALLTLFVCLRTVRFGLKLYPIPLLYSSLISLLVSIASHPLINLPVLLGKRPDGSFPFWSKIMFSPYLIFVRCFCALRRFTSKEDPYNEICQGLYVGGWPSSPEKLPPGEPAIVDCTCELPRRFELSKQGYLCIPTFDTRAPLPGDIESAVKWACMKRSQNRPVFVHCAYGHGRSVAVMCALLVALDLADDWKKAETIIKERRPYIKMNAIQRKALEEWSRNRISTPRKNGKWTNIHFLFATFVLLMTSVIAYRCNIYGEILNLLVSSARRLSGAYTELELPSTSMQANSDENPNGTWRVPACLGSP